MRVGAQSALDTGVRSSFPAAGIWLRLSTAIDKLFLHNHFPRLLLFLCGRGISEGFVWSGDPDLFDLILDPC